MAENHKNTIVSAIVSKRKRKRSPDPQQLVDGNASPLPLLLPHKKRVISFPSNANAGIYCIDPNTMVVSSGQFLRQHAEYDCMCPDICICRPPSCQLCGSYISGNHTRQVCIWNHTYSQVCAECHPNCRNAHIDMLAVRFIIRLFGKTANALVRRHIEVIVCTTKMPKVLVELIFTYLN